MCLVSPLRRCTACEVAAGLLALDPRNLASSLGRARKASKSSEQRRETWESCSVVMIDRAGCPDGGAAPVGKRETVPFDLVSDVDGRILRCNSTKYKDFQGYKFEPIMSRGRPKTSTYPKHSFIPRLKVKLAPNGHISPTDATNIETYMWAAYPQWAARWLSMYTSYVGALERDAYRYIKSIANCS